MAQSPLHRLFHPRSVAVVGVSPKGSYGLDTIANLRKIGFEGAIYPVNPRYREIEGLPVYPSLLELPAVPDTVAIAVPAEAAIEVTRQAVEAGIRTGVVYAAGFAEAGERGSELQRSLTELCAAGGLSLVGPNCLGAVSYAGRAALWGITMGLPQEAGHVAVVSQSGNMVLDLMMHRRGLRLSYAVSCGNGAVLGPTDFVEYFLEAPETRVVVVIVEGIPDVERFRRAADLARERDIRLIALKIGRSEAGQRAVVAHTGILTASDALYDAMFRQHAVIRCKDLEEVVETAKLLSADHRPRGGNIGVFASSGGECGLVADLAEELGLGLPKVPAAIGDLITSFVPTPVVASNPLDISASGWGQREVYRLATTALAEIAEIDVVVCIGDAPSGGVPLPELRWIPMLEGLGDGARATSKPVLVITTVNDVKDELIERLNEQGVTCLVGLETGLRALARAGRAAGFVRRPRPEPILSVKEAERRRARALSLLGRNHLSETDGKRLLALYGIAVPAGGRAADPEEAAELAERLGFPVVVKAEATGLAHKSQVGGVVIGPTSPAEVRRAAAEVQERARGALGLDERSAVRVEAQVEGVAELIVGGGNDPLFGAYVMAGFGGVTAEVLRDVTHRLAPIGIEDARAMLTELRLHPLLEGFRGRPRGDVAAAAEAIARVSELLAELPEIAELDVNPLLVGAEGEGCTALDALVVVRPSAERTSRAMEHATSPGSSIA